MLKRNKITKYFVKTLEKLYNFFPFKIVHTDKHFPQNNKTLNKIPKKVNGTFFREKNDGKSFTQIFHN